MIDKRTTTDVKSVDIEKLRSDMMSKCEEGMDNLVQFMQLIPITNILDLMKPDTMKPIQKTLAIHQESVAWLQNQKSLLSKAKTIEELCSIYNEMSNGLTKKSSELDEVLRETINDSRDNLRKITSR